MFTAIEMKNHYYAGFWVGVISGSVTILLTLLAIGYYCI